MSKNCLKRCFDELDENDEICPPDEPEQWTQEWQTSEHSTQEQPIDYEATEHGRTIIHIDIDCFYAQVEMIHNPSLREKPLGIQQKNIVVTCNYVARKRGVNKLSLVKDAIKICPDLVLVCGEDLTKYREMSYKVTDYFLTFSPLVERLGFDENFIDVTNIVKIRQQSNELYDVEGHIYSTEINQDVFRKCSCGCCQRLAIGSQIAAEMRKGLKESLGLTSCAGIAYNKLLSKLVAGTHKPNQQTVIFPHQTDTLMLSLKNVQQIPGIGSSMSKRLSAMGIVSIQQLREKRLECLKKEFGTQIADTMLKLSHGCDPSPVIKTGPPQSLSDEDSFRKCNSVDDARNRTKQIIRNLLKRLKEDGRVPHTLRLSVRKFSLPKQWTRESRQCPFPEGILLQNLDTESDSVLEKVLDVSMQLFKKLIDTSQQFHLTLISVCLAKLEDRSKKPVITSYFKKSEHLSSNHHGAMDTNLTIQQVEKSVNAYFKKSKDDTGSQSKTTDAPLGQPDKPELKYLKKRTSNRHFEGDKRLCCKTSLGDLVNKEEVVSTFETKDYQEDCISPGKLEYFSSNKKQVVKDSQISENRKLISELFCNQETLDEASQNASVSKENSLKEMAVGGKKEINVKHNISSGYEAQRNSPEMENSHLNQQQLALPADIDPCVFFELPSSVQKELLESWKREQTRKSKPKAAKKSIKDFFTNN